MNALNIYVIIGIAALFSGIVAWKLAFKRQNKPSTL